MHCCGPFRVSIVEKMDKMAVSLKKFAYLWAKPIWSKPISLDNAVKRIKAQRNHQSQLCRKAQYSIKTAVYPPMDTHQIYTRNVIILLLDF